MKKPKKVKTVEVMFPCCAVGPDFPTLNLPLGTHTLPCHHHNESWIVIITEEEKNAWTIQYYGRVYSEFTDRIN